ncbi:hypothetical protein [Mycobacterium colombiense]|uniref:Uncharacterized protein n=1 Tax=Mycobacterium colombiense TaxID=339268 RepID=A0A853M195_9MYCO|nr:hypothetical protein [Mycobacterium colombiense]OBJ12125.1 hypothetical protein A5623_02740 [Mycobacterium colombiense]OBJ62014.1 hypothetical protein A5628_04145 [Mycobacterium colombiense]
MEPRLVSRARLLAWDKVDSLQVTLQQRHRRTGQRRRHTRSGQQCRQALMVDLGVVALARIRLQLFPFLPSLAGAQHPQRDEATRP